MPSKVHTDRCIGTGVHIDERSSWPHQKKRRRKKTSMVSGVQNKQGTVDAGLFLTDRRKDTGSWTVTDRGLETLNFQGAPYSVPTMTKVRSTSYVSIPTQNESVESKDTLKSTYKHGRAMHGLAGVFVHLEPTIESHLT